jgi:hypothetical protein
MSKNDSRPRGLAKLASLAKENLEVIATQPTYHGHGLADLQAAAHPDEWAEIKDKPDVLEVFARSLLERRQIEARVVPERFTKLARCSGCGAVYVPETWPTERRDTRLGEYAVETWDEAESCPWCYLRMQGRRYPKVHPADEHGHPRPRPITWQGKEERAVNAGTSLSAGEAGTDSRASGADQRAEDRSTLPSHPVAAIASSPNTRGQTLLAADSMPMSTGLRLCA